MLRLLVTSQSSEGGDSINIPQATLVSDCVPGPLKDLFQSPFTQGPPGPGQTLWVNLVKDARLSVMLAGFGLTPSVDNGYIFEIVSSVNVLHIECDNQPTQLVVELRFNHSIDR